MVGFGLALALWICATCLLSLRKGLRQTRSHYGMVAIVRPEKLGDDWTLHQCRKAWEEGKRPVNRTFPPPPGSRTMDAIVAAPGGDTWRRRECVKFP